MDRIRVVVIDDDELFAECLEHEIVRDARLTCAARFKSGEEALRQILKLQADIALVDLLLPGGIDGIETVTRLKCIQPRLKCIMLTEYDPPDKVYAAFGAGADGWLPKRTAARPMADAIWSVYNGGVATSPKVVFQMITYFRRRRSLLEALTQVERMVMESCEENGGGYKHIADRLGISENTVKFHVKNILKKSCAQTMAEAITLHKRASSGPVKG